VQPLPNKAHYWDFPLQFDVVWEAVTVVMRQSKWEVVTENKEMGVIRARAYETEERVEFVQVNVKEIDPVLSEVRALSLRQESCTIFTFVHYALKPIIWVATLRLFLWAEFAIGVTARELQRDRSCEERAVLHPSRLGEQVISDVWEDLRAAGLQQGLCK